MARILKTVEEYASQRVNKHSYWLVFNTVYNDVHAFKKEFEGESPFSIFYLNKEYTNYEKREEFLSFMKSKFPEVKLEDVFDLVSSSYLEFPFLGSVAIDCEKDDEVFKALSKKYGNPYEDAIDNNAVFWVIDYEYAKELHDERVEIIDAEFGD